MGRRLGTLGLTAVLALGGCAAMEESGRRFNDMMHPNAKRNVEQGKKYHSYNLGQDLPLIGWILGANAASNTRMKPNQRRAAGYTADLIRDYGVAKAGRSEQNVTIINQGAQQPLPVATVVGRRESDSPGNRFFTCNYWKDLDGDGLAAFSEIRGIKNSFRVGEIGYIVANVRGERGRNLSLRASDEFGHSAFKNFGRIVRDNTYQLQSLNNNMPVGKHLFEWYLDGSLIGRSEVIILPK